MGEVVSLLDRRERVVRFGICPCCHRARGPIHIRGSAWFVCDVHRLKWNVGWDVFPEWRNEDEATWMANSRTLDHFATAAPRYD